MSKRKLSEIKKDIVSEIATINTLIAKNDRDGVDASIERLKEFESEYAGVKRKEVFEELAKDEMPMLAAAKRLSYPVISHKSNKDEGELVSIDIDENKSQRIDLVRFSSFIKHNLVWYYRLERCNEMLAEKVATDLGAKITGKFDLSNGAKKEEKCKYSNTQMTKMLQSIVDELVFIPDDKGKNTVKMTNWDLNYLIDCQVTKDKREYMKVRIAKSREVQGIFLEMLHRTVTDKRYGVAIPTAKETDDTAEVSVKKSTAKAKKPEAKKTEKAAAAEEIAVKKTA